MKQYRAQHFISPLVTFHIRSILSHLSSIFQNRMALVKDYMAKLQCPETIVLTTELERPIKGQ
jgi:hypothetical protein